MTLNEIMKTKQIEVEKGIIKIKHIFQTDDDVYTATGVLEIEKEYEDILDEKWAGIYAGTHKYTDTIEIPVVVYIKLVEPENDEIYSIDWEIDWVEVLTK